jgi:hypothetical protein
MILSQIGEVRLGAGVIRSRLVLSPSGLGFTPPYDISYRGLKLPRFLPPLGGFSCGMGWISRRCLAGTPANYRCSLGTNTVLGLVTNGLFEVLADGGAEN